ncbi:unnamed protein product [Malus baccata var. baccata]
MNLQCDELAEKLEWGARWSIALEIGGSLRYLHEECVDEPIVHKKFRASSIALSHGYSAMLYNLIHAEWLNGIFPPTKDLIFKYDESHFGDVYDYGKFLLELITGKCVRPVHDQGKDPMIEWALSLLENGELGKLMDCRLKETAGDTRMVRHMSHAALRCLKVDSDHKLSISELQSSQREAVIVAVDANRTKGSMEAVEWALKHVVKPGDIFLVLGVFTTDHHVKKNSCFPFKLLMGFGISGIRERIESVDHEEVDPVELGEEFERKRGQYQSSFQPLYRQCSKNEVRLVLKLAAGFCPARLTIKESHNLNTRWIVLDRIEFKLSSISLMRWSIALEIGGSLRYLHEECVDGPIVHKNVRASSVALSHGYSAMLCNFAHAEWLKGDIRPTKDLISKYDKLHFGDVHDYGKFLLELITGKCVSPVNDQGKDQSMIERALPLLENGEFGKLKDCRLREIAGDARMVRNMAHAALRCLKVDSDHKLTISEAVAIVLLQPDPFLNELTSMFEKSTEKGSVWVTFKRCMCTTSMKSKVQRNKMKTAGEEIDYRCLIRATLGNKTISTSVGPKEHQRFQSSYATVLKAHMTALKKRERKEKKKAAESDKKGGVKKPKRELSVNCNLLDMVLMILDESEGRFSQIYNHLF